MEQPGDVLDLFDPIIAEWFRKDVGTPTDVQSAAWPRIAAGEHVLVTAPTGSGKTLTAFLWALNQLLTGDYPEGRCSVLYVSPLKALNNDIRRNLTVPLEQLRRMCLHQDRPLPRIRALTRSGDTPSEDRRRMLRHPPEILITTPESLNLMLSSRGGMSILGSVRAVILDEIHGVIDTKRGTHLITAVERLVDLSGEFQRVALSATVRPLELVAQFVGGYRLLDDGSYSARPVSIVQGRSEKQYDVRVRVSEQDEGAVGTDPAWFPIVRDCRAILERNRSTLIFTNSRRLAESITWKINDRHGDLLAYAHHGSLSREVRTEVEARLKAGELRAIVATNSLEMGIDIGTLDEVILVQSPPRISSAIQRVGRAGHRVGEVSRATVFPTHSHDLLEAAVLARSVLAHDIEAARCVMAPLDVLAQVLVSMAGIATCDLDELYARVRCSYPYQGLSRTQFDLVVDMLSGRYAEARVRGLTPRLSVDRLGNTVAARPGALQDLYISGGTIPDRGYLHLRDQNTNALIGELDEEFVWEAAPGQAMAFATQSWRIERITHNDVYVVPIGRKAQDAPFWKGEEWGRDGHFSELIGSFLEEADGRLESPELLTQLKSEHCLDDAAAKDLVAYLKSQQAHCGGELPHRHHLVVEQVAAGPGGVPGSQVVIHTFWGGTVNRPFALALSAAWQDRFGARPEVYPANDAIYLVMTDDIGTAELMSLVTPENLDGLLRRSLEGSGFFGARFRECAGRALLVTRQRLNQRMPLWVTRLKAKALLEAVLDFEDFPILLETWRTCLQDEFDMAALHLRLTELQDGQTRYSEVRASELSPFARVMSWRQTNKYMYADDTPAGKTESRLRPDLLREVVFSPALRPAVERHIVARFEAKRRRLEPGYSPQSGRDLVDWVKERLLIPLAEWEELLEAMARDHGDETASLVEKVGGKLVCLQPPGSSARLLAAAEDLRRLLPVWGEGVAVAPLDGTAWNRPSRSPGQPDDQRLTAVLAEWLRFYGPVSPAFVGETLGLAPERLLPCVEGLVDSETLIQGLLVQDGAETDICDGENFETLLRMMRSAAAPSFEPLPGADVALLVAHQHGLCTHGDPHDDLWAALECLSGYRARPELWEEAILPARVRDYHPSLLDAAMAEGQLLWLGAPGQRITFALEDDLDLLRADGGRGLPDALKEALADPEARYTVKALLSRSGAGLENLLNMLWEGVWTGAVTNDSMAVLRRGIDNDFKPLALPEPADAGGRGRRRGPHRRRGAVPIPTSVGSWYRVPEGAPADGLLEEEERAKDRARLLLQRHGLLFRELLQQESPQFRWGAVFRALRLMELSGEVVGGCFFRDISGLQFILPTALRRLQRGLPREAVWWINACDPASLCGIGARPLKQGLPRRVAGNYVSYIGAEIALVVQRAGRDLRFELPPEDPRLVNCFGPLHNLLQRDRRPLSRLVVETINGKAAAHSAYCAPLAEAFEVIRDMESLVLLAR